MRITGGEVKGRKIKTRKGKGTRPLLSRVRKSLFDALGERIRGKVFLDLFAGTGAVGIEALSHGAKKAIFVEKDPVCLRIIKENLYLLGLSSRGEIYQGDVLRILPLLLKKIKADFIFIAPPYHKNLQNLTLDILEKEPLSLTCEIIVQHSSQEKLNLEGKKLKVSQKRKYGETILSFLRMGKNDCSPFSLSS